MGSIDWAGEWLSSLIWIAVTSVATVVVAIVGLLLARFTTWHHTTIANVRKTPRGI